MPNIIFKKIVSHLHKGNTIKWKFTLLAPLAQKVDSAIQLLNNRGQDFIRSEIHVLRSGLFKQKGNTFNPFSMKEEREKGRLECNFLFCNIMQNTDSPKYLQICYQRSLKKFVMVVDHVSLTSHVHYWKHRTRNLAWWDD